VLYELKSNVLGRCLEAEHRSNIRD